jgi:transposase
VQNNTIKKETSELTNKELNEIIKQQQTKLLTLKDKYQRTTLESYELQSKLDETRLELDNSREELKKAHEEIAELRYQLNYNLNKKYGKSSDSLPDEQESTFDESDNEEESSTDKQETKKVTVTSHTRNISNKPKSLPEDLPREQLVIDIPDDEKVCSCGCDLKPIGQDKSEKLDIAPAVEV